MMREMTQTSDLIAKMVGRVSVLKKMEQRGLDFKWLQEYDIQRIESACDRMPDACSAVSMFQSGLQRELIENPAFAGYYGSLLSLLPEEPPKSPEPTPAAAAVYGYRNRYDPPVTYKPSRRSVLIKRLENLLKECRTNELDITAYPVASLVDALGIDQFDDGALLVYLENFLSMEQSEEEKQTVICGLTACDSVPLELADWQKRLLTEPFVVTRSLFHKEKFEKICELLQSCPALVDIIRFMHERDISEELRLADYECFQNDTAERCRILNGIADKVGVDNTSEFIFFWSKNGYAVDELRRMERKIETCQGLDWDTVFCNYSGYVNLLFGSRFKVIDLSKVRSYQTDILTYAITHDKKHFIRLVDENAEQFCRLPTNSLLLQESLYREHFNLNELTEKDLDACLWMRSDNLNVNCLTPGRRYTFPELTALYGTSNIYLSLYQMLRSESQDYRLRVFRQLVKQKALKPEMESGLPQLADKLSRKPLQAWKEQEFSHIAGVTAEDILQMLIYFEPIQRVLPDIHSRTDAVLVLKNIERLEQFESLDDLKANIISVDSEWRALAGEIGLSKDFMDRHQETILKFLCKNGAYIARAYANCLDDIQQESFYRVVKAELMGQLHALKYFEGDLQRELDAPLPERVKTGWSQNMVISKNDMEVRECDDFFSTMLLGIQPKRTCMSYKDGAYRSCLLSAFDSNKKVLYVYLHGSIVGRAFLRLTKGRVKGASKKKEQTQFTFVDLENVDTSRQTEQFDQEKLTLFLERPYTSGVNLEQDAQVHQMLIELACAKADELGTMLVLSMDYCPPDETFAQTLFDIYISKSKAGAQYLDSLDGQATVSVEGSYKTNSFLVRKYLPIRAS